MAAAYPTIAEVTTRLTAMEQTAPADATLTMVIALAKKAWEKETGYEPFLGSSSATWSFEPNGTNLVDFRGGFCTITEVKTGVTYSNPTGVTKVAGRDYLLKPDNAENLGKPFEYVTFRSPLSDTNEASVTVTGVRGYCLELPADVWEVIMRQILAFLMPERLLELGGGLEAWKEDDVEERYGAAMNNPLMVVGDKLLRDFKRLAVYYKRLRIVGA